MKNVFYYSSFGTMVSNSWFIQVREVQCTNYWDMCPSKREEYARIKNAFPNGGRVILYMEPREQATALSRQVHGGDMMMPYKVYTFEIEGEDHMRYPVKYTIVVGVTDRAGNTDSLQFRAFERLQTLFMKNGIGCLKKEAIEEIHLYKEFGCFEEINLF